MTHGVRRWLAVLALAGACILVAPPVHAGDPPDAGAEPRMEGQLRDPDFGVRTDEPGLQRVVEMYQWREHEAGYAAAWSAAPIDSSGFAAGHDNPGFPIESRQWLPDSVLVDGLPLDESVLRGLGEWREFRPSFSALPGNLAATFQPEGDGLGSAENPLAPEVGDLRVHWRERVLPPLSGLIEARDGVWHLRPGAPAIAEARTADRGWKRSWLPIAAGGIVLLVLMVVALARRRRR